MSSKNKCTTLTPEQAHFVPILDTTPRGHSSSNQNPLRQEDGHEEASSRFGKFANAARDVVKQNTGLLLFAAAQAFFAMANTAVKKLHGIDPPVTTLQLMVIRMITTFMFCMIYMFVARIPHPILGPKGVRSLLILRGFGGFFGIFGIYYSLQYLSISDAVVLTFLVPTCTAIAGSIFLGEVFSLRQALAGMVSLAGVILIARPATIFGDVSHDGSRPGDQASALERLVAVGVALVGVLGGSVAYISIRAIGKRAHPMHSTVFLSIVCVILSSISMMATKTAIVIPTQVDWLALLLTIVIFGFIAQLLLTMGLQRETAGRGTMAHYTQIVFAVILEYIVFHTVPQFLSIIGTLMIIVSALYIVVTKQKGQASIGKSVTLPRFSEDVLERAPLLSATTPNQNSYDGRSPGGPPWTISN